MKKIILVHAWHYTQEAGQEWEMREDRNNHLSNLSKLEKQLSVIQVFLDVNALSIHK